MSCPCAATHAIAAWRDAGTLRFGGVAQGLD
jgi:hypothetical protein